MTVDATRASAGTTAAARSGVKLAADFDSFLKLLTTQLTTQDPLSPMDAEQFTSQLVQFSGVEQAIQTNTKLEMLIGLMQANQTTAALQYIGATVELDTSAIALAAGGTAEIAYELPETAAAVLVEIQDGSGRLVRQLTGPAAAGPRSLVWDGRDGAGAAQPAGTYSVAVAAVDPLGREIPVPLDTVGRVEALTQTTAGLRLTVDGRTYPVESVRSVRPAA
ncbi:MAG: flagellar hook capping FlgD N-terminal domain-containing protein [Geminicoccaceae bacterium]|jgi:flagellar basal-body rod modification protein FlgD|nr:flagellar hook capping FlgD N-terminal domain-containing protein [Geminicoccaceae bacterium]